ncbi:MAG: twin-arginine translocase subunit TatC, partial [Chloroflexi bacterium]|nr:twin-arginine translocase subunit TatC [Chloroflexota bacterium]
SPGLTPREQRFLYALLPAAFLAFAAGAAFAYFVLVPPALRFLLSWGGDIARPQIRIGNYVNVVTTLVFWVGVVFEMPLVVAFLARLGVISHRTLWRFQRWAIVLAFVLGAIITPTFDPINQSLVALPLIVLYQVSILLAWLLRRQPRAEAVAASAAPTRPETGSSRR